MHIQASEIRACLDKALELTAQYKLYVLASDGFPKSIDDFEWICSEYLGFKIEIYELDDLQVHKDKVPPEQWAIRGFYLSMGTNYEVYILGGQNPCWNRFVRTKELFHMLMDQDCYRTTEIYHHIKEVAAKFPQIDSIPGRSAVSEMMAEIAAMEFIFPYERRLIEKVGRNPDYYRIAEYYKIPQYYVEKYLDDGMMKTLGAFFFTPSQKS